MANNSTVLLSQSLLASQTSNHFRLNPSVFSTLPPSNNARKTLTFSSSTGAITTTLVEPNDFSQEINGRDTTLGSTIFHSRTEHSLQPSSMTNSSFNPNSSNSLDRFPQSFSASDFSNVSRTGNGFSPSTTAHSKSYAVPQILRSPAVTSATAIPQSISSASSIPTSSQSVNSSHLNSSSLSNLDLPSSVPTGPDLSASKIMTPQVADSRPSVPNAFSFSAPVLYAHTASSGRIGGSAFSAASLDDSSRLSQASSRGSLLLSSRTYHGLSTQFQQAINCKVFVTESSGSSDRSDMSHLSDQWETEESVSTIGSINDDQDEPQPATPRGQLDPDANSSDANQQSPDDTAHRISQSPMLVDNDSSPSQLDPTMYYQAHTSSLPDPNEAIRASNAVAHIEIAGQTQPQFARVDENTSASTAALSPRCLTQTQEDGRQTPAQTHSKMSLNGAASRSERLQATGRSPVLSNSSRNNANRRTPPAGADTHLFTSPRLSPSVSVSFAPTKSFSESRDAEWEQHEDEEADRQVRAIGRSHTRTGRGAATGRVGVVRKKPVASKKPVARAQSHSQTLRRSTSVVTSSAHAASASNATQRRTSTAGTIAAPRATHSTSAKPTAKERNSPSRTLAPVLQRTTSTSSNVGACGKGAAARHSEQQQQQKQEARATSSFSVLLMPLANKARVFELHKRGGRLEDVKKLPCARFISISPVTSPSEEYEIATSSGRYSLLNIKFNRRGLPIRPMEIDVDDWEQMEMQLVSGDSTYLLFLIEPCTKQDSSKPTTPRSSLVNGATLNNRPLTDTADSFLKKRPATRREGERRVGGPPLKRFRRLHISGPVAGTGSDAQHEDSSESSEPADSSSNSVSVSASKVHVQRALFSRTQHSSLLYSNEETSVSAPISSQVSTQQATARPVAPRPTRGSPSSSSSTNSSSTSASSSGSPTPVSARHTSQSVTRPSVFASTRSSAVVGRVRKCRGDKHKQPETPKSSKQSNAQRVKFIKPDANPFDFNEKDSDEDESPASSSSRKLASRRGGRSSANADKRHRVSALSKQRGHRASSKSSSGAASVVGASLRILRSARARCPYQLRDLGRRTVSEQPLSALSCSNKRIRRARGGGGVGGSHVAPQVAQQRHYGNSMVAPPSSALHRTRAGKFHRRRSEPPPTAATAETLLQPSMCSSIAPGSLLDDSDVALVLSGDE